MSDKKVFISSSIIAFLVLLFLGFNTIDGYGGADSFQHYMISHYSWKHPFLLLDNWGKPLFTLLSSPFSQLGYKGLLMFNLLVVMMSSFFVYRISAKLEGNNAAVSALFFLLMPMVVLTSVSALTEPLFGLVLVLSVWLYSEKKYFLAIALLSSLPLVRSEGFVVFPVFILALLLSRNWKYIPLFFVGGLIYSLIGYITFDDFFWLIYRSPYKMESGIYGSGTWYHFIRKSGDIFGITLFVFIFIGSLFSIPNGWKWFKEENNILRLLVAWSFAAYFISHSYVWWKGTGGSLGLERVIAGVCPLAAIIALSGFSFIAKGIRNYFSPAWFLVPLVFLIFKETNYVVSKELKQRPEEKLMNEVAEWIKSKPELINQRLFYYNPHIAFLLDKDIFDKREVEQLWGLIDEDDPLLWLKDGQYLVWDSHFGNVEGKTPLNKILHKKNVRVLKHFMPDEQYFALGGEIYEIFVFGKQGGWKDTIVEYFPVSSSAFSTLKNQNISVEKENEYTGVFNEELRQLSKSAVVYMDISVRYSAEIALNNDALFFVLDMNCNQHTIKYDVSDISKSEQVNGEMVLNKRILLPPLTEECSNVKTYLWNRGKIDLHGIKIDVKFSHVLQSYE